MEGSSRRMERRGVKSVGTTGVDLALGKLQVRIELGKRKGRHYIPHVLVFSMCLYG